MDKGVPSSLFVNDGSFMERFKQLQQEKDKGPAVQDSRPQPKASGGTPGASGIKIGTDSRHNNQRKIAAAPSGGKLAFSLKQKSKLVAPVKLIEDDDEDEADVGNASDSTSAKRQKFGPLDASGSSFRKVDVAYILSPFQQWGNRCSMNDMEIVARCYKSNLHSVVHALDINQFFK